MFPAVAVVAFLGQMFLASAFPATAAPATATAAPATGTPAANNNPAPFNPFGDLSSIIKNYNNANMLAWAGSKPNLENIFNGGIDTLTSPFAFALAPFGLTSFVQDVPKGIVKAGLGISDGLATGAYGIINGLADSGAKAGQFTSPIFSMPQQFLGSLGQNMNQLTNTVNQIPKSI